MKRANFSAKTKQLARERANHTCELAGCEEPANEVDHIKACWQGGENTLENAQVLCRKHHARKTAKELDEKASTLDARKLKLKADTSQSAEAVSIKNSNASLMVQLSKGTNNEHFKDSTSVADNGNPIRDLLRIVCAH
jgi:5-methylcytosine-specific restriction endonuclease McrA